MSLTIIERPAHKNNWSLRPPGVIIDTIVLHDTGGKTAESALRWFENPQAKVSSHYVVDLGGTIYRPVQENDKAWHAGASSLWGDLDLNRRSISIEIVDDDDATPYPPRQMSSIVDLTCDIAARRRIWVNRIVGHEHISIPPGRKRDPGKDFPWELFLLTVANQVNATRGGTSNNGRRRTSTEDGGNCLQKS